MSSVLVSLSLRYMCGIQKARCQKANCMCRSEAQRRLLDCRREGLQQRVLTLKWRGPLQREGTFQRTADPASHPLDSPPISAATAVDSSIHAQTPLMHSACLSPSPAHGCVLASIQVPPEVQGMSVPVDILLPGEAGANKPVLGPHPPGREFGDFNIQFTEALERSAPAADNSNLSDTPLLVGLTLFWGEGEQLENLPFVREGN